MTEIGRFTDGTLAGLSFNAGDSGVSDLQALAQQNNFLFSTGTAM
jgi:hypothetical protein